MAARTTGRTFTRNYQHAAAVFAIDSVECLGRDLPRTQQCLLIHEWSRRRRARLIRNVSNDQRSGDDRRGGRRPTPSRLAPFRGGSLRPRAGTDDKRRDLLLAQRAHWLHERRSRGRDQRGKRRDGEDDTTDAEQRHRIEGRYPEQQSRQRAPYGQ